MRSFPSLSEGIPMIFVFLVVVWCGVGLFIMGGKLLTKYSKGDGDDKASNQSLQPTAGRCESTFDFVKQFSMFATLASASGGSAPSR